MSRSKKKHPFTRGGSSNKKDRTVANKKMRRLNHILLKDCDDDTLFNNLRDVSNPWSFKSDGLAMYFGYIDRHGEPLTIIEQHKYYGK